MKLTVRDKLSIFFILLCIVVISSTFALRCSRSGSVNFNDPESLPPPPKESEYLFEICIDSLNVTNATVESGQTLSSILSGYGLTPSQIHRISEACKGKFDLRNVRAGNNYNIFTTMDSIQQLQYFVYEQSATEYVTIDLRNEIPTVKTGEKPVQVERRIGEAVIESSLWNAAIEAGMSSDLTSRLSDVYQWSIDFYAIQKGDKFKVIYDERFVDGKSIGAGTIWGAWFDHDGKRFYAIRHEVEEGGKVIAGYYDETGKTLQSAFLKAPLQFTRISSRFSYSRLHPVLRIRRPHLGVDYAAPTGTPVRAIGSGVVTMRQYSGGGGNTIKIRHDVSGYMSGYLHLSRYAKGLKVGSRVKQGEIIGYVGSTGVSTGPHLDFRMWKNGKAIDPLKISDVKGVDIKPQYRSGFELSKRRVLADLNGEQLSRADSVALKLVVDTLPASPLPETR